MKILLVMKKLRGDKKSLDLKIVVIKNIILNNPLSYSPYSDDQTIDLMLLFLFLKKCDSDGEFIKDYLNRMTNQIGYLFQSMDAIQLCLEIIKIYIIIQRMKKVI